MKSHVKLLVAFAFLAMIAGMIPSDAEAGRRCRRARRCCVVVCKPVCYKPVCCKPKCCKPVCCKPVCCKPQCCENSCKPKCTTEEGSARFSIEEETASCCKPKGEKNNDEGTTE